MNKHLSILILVASVAFFTSTAQAQNAQNPEDIKVGNILGPADETQLAKLKEGILAEQQRARDAEILALFNKGVGSIIGKERVVEQPQLEGIYRRFIDISNDCQGGPCGPYDWGTICRAVWIVKTGNHIYKISAVAEFRRPLTCSVYGILNNSPDWASE